MNKAAIIRVAPPRPAPPRPAAQPLCLPTMQAGQSLGLVDALKKMAPYADMDYLDAKAIYPLPHQRLKPIMTSAQTLPHGRLISAG